MDVGYTTYFIHKNDIDYEYASFCDCINGKISKSLMDDSGITPEFLKMTFQGFNTDGVMQPIRNMKDIAFKYYMDFEQIKNTRNNSIALLGQPGSGKTHLLSALCNNLIQNKRKSVQYFPYVEEFETLKGDLQSLNKKLDAMKNKDILFIDDLFKPSSKVINGQRKKVPSASEWEIKQIYAVINYRYMNYKPIFISSELSFDDMLELDEALASRIIEMSKNYYIQIEKDIQLNYRLKM